jgi:uncharacterized protein YdiU (UPF0061 family)
MRNKEKAIKTVNPNFVPRVWLRDEVIERVEKMNDREIVGGIMQMMPDPQRLVGMGRS